MRNDVKEEKLSESLKETFECTNSSCYFVFCSHSVSMSFHHPAKTCECGSILSFTLPGGHINVSGIHGVARKRVSEIL